MASARLNSAHGIKPLTIPHQAGGLFVIPDDARSMGVHVMAGRGSGKSRLLGKVVAWLDFLRGVPTVLIDPLGGAIDYFLDQFCWLPPEVQQQFISRLAYIDMSGKSGLITPFPLYYDAGDDSPFSISQRYLDVIRKLDPALQSASIQGFNAISRIGTDVGMVLAGQDLQITEAEDLLRHPEAWLSRLAQLAEEHEAVRPAALYLIEEYSQLTEIQRRPLIDSFLTKIAVFRRDPTARAMFGASRPGMDWHQVVERGQTVLVDFRGVEHLDDIRFRMLWLWTNLLSFIKRRGQGRHKPLSVIIDELTYLLSLQGSASNLLEADLDEFINRVMRSHQIWLTLAHQELYQVNEYIQDTLMSMGTQILGVTTDPGTARALARRFHRYRPLRVKKYEPMYMSDMGSAYVVDYRSVEYSIDEQVELNSRYFLDLPRYHFLVAAAPEEGTVGTTVERITIERFDQGKFINQRVVSQAKAYLSKATGRPRQEILAEIDARARDALSMRSVVDTMKLHRAADAPHHDDDLLTDKRSRKAPKTPAPASPSRRGRTPQLPSHRARPGNS